MKIINAILGMLMATFSCQEQCYLGAVEVQVGTLTKVTAYCPCRECCGRWSIHKTTASGHKVKKGDRFAAAPREIPFGTMIIVPGYNEGRPVPVLDRGGKVNEKHIDIFFDTHAEAIRWGVKYLDVRGE